MGKVLKAIPISLCVNMNPGRFGNTNYFKDLRIVRIKIERIKYITMAKAPLMTTSVDKHRDQLTREGMEKALSTLTGTERMRWLINHRRDLPPLGYISDVEMVDKGDVSMLIGEFYRYDERMDISENPEWVMEKSKAMFPLLNPSLTIPEKLTISIDKNNFSSLEEFTRTNAEIYRILNTDFEMVGHARKADVPTVELIFRLADKAIDWLLVWALVKPFATKAMESFGETLGKKAGEDSWQLSKKALKALKLKVCAVAKLLRSKTFPRKKGW